MSAPPVSAFKPINQLALLVVLELLVGRHTSPMPLLFGLVWVVSVLYMRLLTMAVRKIMVGLTTTRSPVSGSATFQPLLVSLMALLLRKRYSSLPVLLTVMVCANKSACVAALAGFVVSSKMPYTACGSFLPRSS